MTATRLTHVRSSPPAPAPAPSPDTVARAHADPRTVLLLLVAVNAVVLGRGAFSGVVAGGLLATVLLASTGPRGRRRSVTFLAVFVLFAALYQGLPWLPASNATALLAALGFWMSRFVVAIGLAAYAVAVIRPTELTAALRSLRIPGFITIPGAVALRIMPVIVAEARAIGEAMTLRGVRPGFWTLLRHPVKSGEMLLIPLLSTVVRAGDELAASALIRGLGGPARPTTVADLRFRLIDAALILAGATVVAAALIPGGIA